MGLTKFLLLPRFSSKSLFYRSLTLRLWTSHIFANKVEVTAQGHWVRWVMSFNAQPLKALGDPSLVSWTLLWPKPLEINHQSYFGCNWLIALAVLGLAIRGFTWSYFALLHLTIWCQGDNSCLDWLLLSLMT